MFFSFFSKDTTSLLGKRIGMFSYGSGLASTMFSLQISDEFDIVEPLISGIKDVAHRLDSRKCVSPEEFSAILKSKEETHHLGKLFLMILFYFFCFVRFMFSFHIVFIFNSSLSANWIY